jgi:hypothetical protein
MCEIFQSVLVPEFTVSWVERSKTHWQAQHPFFVASAHYNWRTEKWDYIIRTQRKTLVGEAQHLAQAVESINKTVINIGSLGNEFFKEEEPILIKKN